LTQVNAVLVRCGGRFGKFDLSWADDHFWAGEEEEEEVEEAGEGVECVRGKGDLVGDGVPTEVEPPGKGVGEDAADVYRWITVFDVRNVL